MDVQFTPELLAYMEQHGKKTVLVELVKINNSDFEITELHVRFADGRLREQFVGKKGYRVLPAGAAEVLLPRFPLELEETVTFGLKRVLFWNVLTYSGIKV